MPKLKFWAALSGSVWMAAMAVAAVDFMVPPEACASVDTSFPVVAAPMVFMSFLFAIPATFGSSVIEPVFRAITPPHRGLKAMACALAEGLAGNLTYLFPGVARNIEQPNGNEFRRARPGDPAGILCGALVFGACARGAARV